MSERTELLLSLLYAGIDLSDKKQIVIPIEGITRLQKLLFLLKYEAGLPRGTQPLNDFNFIPFRMGAWSNEVYDEVDFLESIGLIQKKSTEKYSPIDDDHTDELFNNMIIDKYQKSEVLSDEETQIFSLTNKGEKKAEEIWEKLPNEIKEKIIAIKRKFNTMNLRQLLIYVYRKYPQFTAKSDINDFLIYRK